MRKQVDFDVRVFPLGTGSGGDSMTREQVSAFLRDNYLSLSIGWEIMNVNVNQVSAGVIYLQVSLVRWEDVTEEVKAKSK